MDHLSNFHELVALDGDQLLTDSRIVAKTFGKRHTNVLRAYDNLKCSADFIRHNFKPVEYTDEKGEQRAL